MSAATARPGRRRIVMISGYHDYRSKRRADLHFLCEAFAREAEVFFLSVRYSLINRLQVDPRHDLTARANRIETVDGVRCLLVRTLLHPIRLPAPLAVLERAAYRRFGRRLPHLAVEAVAQADIVYVESGIAVTYLPAIRALNPRARLIYVGSDGLATINQAAPIREALRAHAGLLSAARLAAPQLRADLPPEVPCYLIPHGIDRAQFARAAPSPYPAGSRNAVSVGSMLFDESFFRIAAALFPDVVFHVIGSGATMAPPGNVRLYPEMPFAETLPFLKHCDVAIAPYRAGVPAYLTHSSMKLAQYNVLGKPAVCPEAVAGSGLGRFGYVPGDPASIDAAIRAALDQGSVAPGPHLSWDAVAERFLEPERWPETRVP